jgi:hypothetical protein
MSVHGVPCGSTGPRKSADGLSTGFMGVCGGPGSPTHLDYESEGPRFESCRAHYKIPANAAFLLREILSEIGLNHPIDHLSISKSVSQAPFGAIGSAWIRTLGASHG